jgi:hypothetical protein
MKDTQAKQCVRQEHLAKQCPWCQRWSLKDNACAYIFACGLDYKDRFHVGLGCGKSWCWKCGKKYCGQYYDPQTGQKLPTAKDHHDAFCCRKEEGFQQSEFCAGGCSGHCVKRWDTDICRHIRSY